VCITWKIKCWILLMDGVTMKIMIYFLSLHVNYTLNNEVRFAGIYILWI